jgi:hypothetical protein
MEYACVPSCSTVALVHPSIPTQSEQYVALAVALTCGTIHVPMTSLTEPVLGRLMSVAAT